MKKNKSVQTKSQANNDDVKALLISMQKELRNMAHDLKMLKIEQSLDKVSLSHEILKVYERINQTKSEIQTQIRNLDEKVDTQVMEKLDSIIGDFKRFDEEREVLAYRQANHSDRIEKLETSVFGKPSEP